MKFAVVVFLGMCVGKKRFSLFECYRTLHELPFSKNTNLHIYVLFLDFLQQNAAKQPQRSHTITLIVSGWQCYECINDMQLHGLVLTHQRCNICYLFIVFSGVLYLYLICLFVCFVFVLFFGFFTCSVIQIALC